MSKIKIPKSWNDITVLMFRDLYPFLMMTDNPLLKVQGMVSVVSKLTIDEVINEMTIAEYDKARKQLSFLNDWDSLKDVESTFKIDGVRYSIDVNLKNSTGGQYMSTMSLLKGVTDVETGKMDNGKLFDKLHLILACFITEDERKRFRWVRGKFDETKFEEIADKILNNMTMKQAFPIAVFFCRFMEKLTETMPDFLQLQEEEINEVLKQVRTDLAKHGAGT